MVEEDEYRSTYHAINDQRCIFEKTILTHKSSCSQSMRFFLADREGIRCNSTTARQLCAQLLPTLRQKALFALGIPNADDSLPYTKEIRIQTGSMLGLQRLLTNAQQDPESVTDIHTLINQSLAAYGSIDDLPFQEIVKSINRFKGRKKNKRTR